MNNSWYGATQKRCLKIPLHNMSKNISSCGCCPLSAALWLAADWWAWISLMTFVKCHRRAVSPIFRNTFHFKPSIIGSHKNNLSVLSVPVIEENHHLITTPVWGADYGTEGAQQQSWAWGVLVGSVCFNGCMGMSAGSFSRSTSLPPLKLLLKNTDAEVTFLRKVECPLSRSIKRAAARAVESHSVTPCYQPGSF